MDETFRSQTLDNSERFAAFPDTARLFLPGGDAPEVGSTFVNPDLAATYRLLAERGTVAGFYHGGSQRLPQLRQSGHRVGVRGSRQVRR